MSVHIYISSIIGISSKIGSEEEHNMHFINVAIVIFFY